MKTFCQALTKHLKKAHKKITKKALVHICNKAGKGLATAANAVGVGFRRFGYNFMHNPSKQKPIFRKIKDKK